MQKFNTKRLFLTSTAILFLSVDPAFADCAVTSGSGTVSMLQSGDVVSCDNNAPNPFTSSIGSGAGQNITINLLNNAVVNTEAGEIHIEGGSISLGEGASIESTSGSKNAIFTDTIDSNLVVTMGNNSKIQTQGSLSHGVFLDNFNVSYLGLNMSGDNSSIRTDGDGSHGIYMSGASKYMASENASVVTLTGENAEIHSGTGAAIKIESDYDAFLDLTLEQNTSVISDGGTAILVDANDPNPTASEIDSAGLIRGGDKSIQTSSGDDILTLRTGSNLESPNGADLGGGDDTLNLIGHANEDEDFINIETLNVNADSTGWTLSGTSNFNDVEVNTGSFENNGTITVSNQLDVMSAAEFGGAGNVIGNVVNAGTVAPGSSIGTQVITGNYVQGGGGALNIEFGSAGIDLLDISGTANIDGTLNLTELSSGAALNTPLVFLDADGGLTGTFSTVNKVFLMGTALTEATVGYDANSAFVTLEDFNAAFEAKGISSSGSKVGKALDTAAENPTPQVTAIINAIENSPNTAAALDSQGNAVVNTATTQANGAVGQVVNVVRARLASNSGNTGQTGVSAGDQYGRWADEGTYWAQAVGAVSDIDGDSNALGSDSIAYGAAAGVEYAYNTHTTIGAFAGYTRSETDVDGLDDESEVSNYQLGLYGTHELGNNWNFNGTLSASYLQFNTERPTVTGTATADFGGYGGYATGELSYDIETHQDFTVTPYAALEASIIDRESYSESGAGVLNNDVESDTTEYLTSVIGTKISGDYEVGGDLEYRILPTARLGWAHQYLDDSAKTTASFADTSSAVFETQGPERNRDSLRLGFDLEISRLDSDSVSGFVRYDGDMAIDAQDHMIRVGAGFKF